MAQTRAAFGEQIRDWRQRRRLSQLELAGDARISTRHLSFIETGRSRPSRGMVLHLAELLDVPLRERNVLLQAAGYSPAFPAHALDEADTHAGPAPSGTAPAVVEEPKSEPVPPEPKSIKS